MSFAIKPAPYFEEQYDYSLQKKVFVRGSILYWKNALDQMYATICTALVRYIYFRASAARRHAETLFVLLICPQLLKDALICYLCEQSING